MLLLPERAARAGLWSGEASTTLWIEILYLTTSGRVISRNLSRAALRDTKMVFIVKRICSGRERVHRGELVIMLIGLDLVGTGTTEEEL
jgi:hypothetical protein